MGTDFERRTSPAAAEHAPSLCQQKLAPLLALPQAQRSADLVEFWKAWTDWGGAPIDDQATLSAALEPQDSPEGMLALLESYATSPPSGQALSKAHSDARETIFWLALTVAEALTRRSAQASLPLDDGSLALTVRDDQPLLTDLVATALGDTGFDPEHGPNGMERAANALRGRRALGLPGTEHGAQLDATMQQVALYTQRPRDGAGVLARAKGPVPASPSMVPNPGVLRAALGVLERRFKLRPVLLASFNEAGVPGVAAEVRAELLRTLGVDVLYQRPGHQLQEADQRSLAEFEDALGGSVARIIQALYPGEPSPAAKDTRAGLFVSYSHKDTDWMERVVGAIRALPQHCLPELWIDEQEIDTGDDWLQKIKDGMQRATGVVFCVSNDFLASAFIRNKELPTLLAAHQSRQGFKVFPIQVRYSVLTEWEALTALQVSCKNESLAELEKKSQHDRALSEFAQSIADHFKSSHPLRG
ncbi:MAG: toll/interleukin-1 receptor domain-containing protein [Rubrivivax sp.]|nr:toll/interleukin-1 receptor domain-containing protein [Rubrivivax sp.]